jgi:hypothetical protein
MLEQRRDNPDGKLRDGWEFVPEGWMCPLCLIMSTRYRSGLPLEAQADETDWISWLSLDGIAERFGVSRERMQQMAVETADPVKADE